MKSILLHIHDDSALDDRVQVALDLCRSQDAHLSCLQVTPYTAYVSFDPLGGVYAQGSILESLREREAEIRTQVEERLAKEGIRWDWENGDGDVAQTLVNVSALSDLLIVSQQDREANAMARPLPIVDELAVHAHCATLVCPKGVNSFASSTPIVIGWNATPEAASAIRLALPMIKAASQVYVVSVGDDGADIPQTAASTYLSRHGVSSELHGLAGKAGAVGQILHDFAASKGAGCIVMGAYGRSRLRETILGGVSHTLLGTSRIPLLLGH